MLADLQDKPESSDGTQGAYEYVWYSKTLEFTEVDGRRTRYNHDIEEESAETVQKVVVDVFALHNLRLLQTFYDAFNHNSEQRA